MFLSKKVNTLGYEKIAMTGILGAISVVLGVMENFFPAPMPGVRLGLANLPVIMMLYTGGVIPAMLVMILKITLVPLFSGAFIFRLSLSLPSGAMAFLGMAICALFLKRYTSLITTGVAGAALHMLTQLWVIDRFYIYGLLSASITGWLIIVSLFTGILTGAGADILISRLQSVLPYSFRKNKPL
ncbi:MAG: Gx transporter family protein [Deferribacteraceae bacterium]|jgi:heptaprenyl diphosphate synthase|nr:Gx transporter family protein [Deferribacteraceae bacterium]